MKNIEKMREELFLLKDEKYAVFQRKLLPGINPHTIIGVRTPELRKIAKRIEKGGVAEEFLNNLPHIYFEENQIHAFIIAEIRDMDICVNNVDKFLAYVNNWATCDQLNPRIFKENKEKLLEKIHLWITSENVYNVRFAIKMMMDHFLEKDFSEEYLRMAAKVEREEYYIKMMVSWYFATALAKQYEATLPFIKENRLMPWVHGKTIQKAVESRRLTPEQKLRLKQYRRR